MAYNLWAQPIIDGVGGGSDLHRIAKLLAAMPRLVAYDDSEAATTGTTAADLLTISGLSIPTSSAVKLSYAWRRTADAGSILAYLGLKVNSTIVNEANGTDYIASIAGVATYSRAGVVDVWLMPSRGSGAHNTSPYGSVGFGYSYQSQGAAPVNANAIGKTNLVPDATITSLTIRAAAASGSITTGVSYFRIYEYPVPAFALP